MKTLRIIGIIAATASALALSSCRKEVAPTLTGEEIIFTAGSESDDTKTVYSGSESSNRERIDWQAGDQIRIYCDQLASDPKYGDYFVTEALGPDESKPYISKARVKALGGKPLVWGESSAHYFYSAYPSPNYGESSAVKSIGKNSTSGHIEASAEIPAVQPYRGSVSVDGDGLKYVAEPNLRNMVMTAKAGPYSVESDIPGRKEVFMSFIPLTTAIRFTITNQTKEPLVLESVSLISASKALNGAFTVDIDNAATPDNITVGSTTISYSREYPACTRSATVADAEKTVTIPFGGEVVLPYDEDKSKCGSLTFTFFVQPCDNLDGLTFKIVKHKDGNTCWLSTKLAYANGTGLMFPRHKKSDVTGLLIPEGAIWTVKYAPEIEPWDDEDHGKITPDPELDPDVLVTPWIITDSQNKEMAKYNYMLDLSGETNFGHDGTCLLTPGATSTLNVSSMRELDMDYNYVVWYMEYFDEATDSWKMVKNNETMNGLVTLTADGFVSSGGEFIFNRNKDITMSVAAAAGTEVIESQSHTLRLADPAAVRGTQTAPYDLSMHTIYGDAREKAKTANCYIVKGQGWYAFPLVYGNAIDDNVAPAGYINVNAYNPGGETDPTVNVLTRFRNYKGYGIRQPYIEEDLKVIPVAEGTPLHKVNSAAVLWQSGTCITNCTIKSAADAWGLGLTSMKGAGMTANACGYVVFQVDDTIAQGNAVIAVKDQDNKIIWSWHIWITDDEMDLVSFRNYGGQTVKMLPVNLGWVDSNNNPFTYFAGKSVKLRLVQEGSNIVKEFTVVRRPETTAPHETGTSPYYQWGRKDPFRSGCSTTAVSASTDIAYSIQNPGTFVTGGNHYRYYNESIGPAGNSNPASYLNLWSALVKEVGTVPNSSTTIKTIYDPCPPGFQIPHGTAYTGFTKTGENSTTGSDFNVSGNFNNGWYFTTGAGDESNFFPAGGCFNGSVAGAGNGYYWTSAPINTQGRGIYLYFDGSSVNVKDVADQSDGFTVRPVMEEHL